MDANQRGSIELALFGKCDATQPRSDAEIVRAVKQLRDRYDALREATCKAYAGAPRWCAHD